VPARPGFDLVLTKDAIVEGVHFLPDDPPDLVARKLLRVNLSDLAAKAAEPFGYLLAVAWPERWEGEDRARFAAGLAEDQAEFGLVLLGGDTVSTPGPMTASATLLGYAPEGRAIRRAGARPGQGVFVSGPIGDGWLGLQAARGELSGLPDAWVAQLATRYRLPSPRLDLRAALLEGASACADISDGLVADLGHVARASGAGASLDLETVPLSAGATAWLDAQPDRREALVRLVTGGDDYQLVFTAARPLPGANRIGTVTEGEGVRVRLEGDAVPISRAGWSHG
jgi:thiamine-monophosphate kinase